MPEASHWDASGLPGMNFMPTWRLRSRRRGLAVTASLSRPWGADEQIDSAALRNPEAGSYRWTRALQARRRREERAARIWAIGWPGSSSLGTVFGRFRPLPAATMGRKPAFLRGFLFWPRTAKMRVRPPRSERRCTPKKPGPPMAPPSGCAGERILAQPIVAHPRSLGSFVLFVGPRHRCF